jgi:hypothetical protein
MAYSNINSVAYTCLYVLTEIRSHDLIASVEGAIWSQPMARIDRQPTDL